MSSTSRPGCWTVRHSMLILFDQPVMMKLKIRWIYFEDEDFHKTYQKPLNEPLRYWKHTSIFINLQWFQPIQLTLSQVERSVWQLSVQVGSQSISPLFWALRTSSSLWAWEWQPNLTNWCHKTGYVHPENWGRWIHFDSSFSDGLVQPPTRCCFQIICLLSSEIWGEMIQFD